MRKTQQLLALIMIVVALFASGCSSSSTVTQLSVEETASLLASPPDGLVVLDIRTAEEFNSGHIAGAEMIDFYSPSFKSQLAELDRDTPYLMYCRTGNRSGQASKIFDELGFTNVSELKGGIVDWQAAGEPLQ